MLNTPELFFQSIKDKTVAFVGVGVTNNDLIKLFARRGIDTYALDQRTEDKHDRHLLQEFRDLRVTLRLGTSYLNNVNADIIFRAPGMYFYHPEIATLRKHGKIVTSEMEVFFDICPCPIIAVTGSDGKSTTATLIAEMLKTEGKTVHLGGNIGIPMLANVFDIQREDFAVVELSSFQLLSMRNAPERSVVTNVEPNHLDVHGSMGEYIDAKRNIFLHQNAFSHTVLNKDNEITESFLPEVRGRAATFSLTEKVYHGAYLSEEGILTAVNYGEETPLFHQSAIRIPGRHNVANFLAAISAVQDIVSPETIETVARQFAGVEHRIEFIREKDQVCWYNDSIATSPTRVLAALNSFEKDIVLIAGGYDKQLPYEPMIPTMLEKVRVLILNGPAAKRIQQSVESYPGYDPDTLKILTVPTLKEAVPLAEQEAKRNEVVILSPICASFDAYPNFEVRGQHFKELVNQL